MKCWLVILALPLLGGPFPSAIADDAGPSKTFTPEDFAYFEKRIRPLLVKRCYECHSQKKGKKRGGLRVDSRSALLSGGDSGPAIVPGRPDASELISAVRYTGDGVDMPPTGKLPDSEIKELEKWIARGAPFPQGEADEPADSQGIDFEQAREFWSFQPVRTHPLPDVDEADWPRRRIDAFVLSKLEAGGLSHSSEADRSTLIRRVTFDLIGLPPTPAEVRDFTNDGAPDAYERLVDRLLSSPHFGERWGRFWLDLARYADSTPEWLKSTGRAWVYRDWVVGAMNGDVPYDIFVTKQLAADLLPDYEPADIPALGFLGLSPTYWKELKLDKNVIKTVVAEEWDERIDAVSRTFLGLTVACARCHDHKFDPVSTEDYYALAGVFASTRLIDLPMLPEPRASIVKRARLRVAELEEEVEALKASAKSSDDKKARTAELQAMIDQIVDETPNYDALLAHGLEDASLYVLADGPDQTKLEYRTGEPRDVPIYLRGNPANTGPVVARRFLKVLSTEESRPFSIGSGRLELAQSILGEGRSLAARVIVNRVWREHFGSGLVTTPSNFGTQGEPPSHPQLLDDLAARFVANNWSLKWLHREIVLSATYRQASAPDAKRNAVDPGNRMLWRMNRRRLSIESWRDAMLAVSRSLSEQLGGPPQELASPENNRRTLYGRIARRDLDEMLRLYDFPDPASHSPGREPTTTPLQQLFVLNSPFVRRQSFALVERLLAEPQVSTKERLQAAYALLYSRPVTKAEVALAEQFLDENGSDDAAAHRRRWQLYAQILLGANEFMFID